MELEKFNKKQKFVIFWDGAQEHTAHYLEETQNRTKFYYNWGNVVTQTPIRVKATVQYDGSYVSDFAFMAKDIISACKVVRKCLEIFSRGSLKSITFQQQDLRKSSEWSDEVAVFRSQEDEGESGDWVLFSDEHTILKEKIGTREEVLARESCYTKASRNLVRVNEIPCRDFDVFEKTVTEEWNKGGNGVTISSQYITSSWFEKVPQPVYELTCEKEVE